MSIQKRTVFYDFTGNITRFWDWAQTKTTLGVMAEPFLPNGRHLNGADFESFDPEDEIARVDEMRAMSVDKHQLVLSGGSDHLHGGYQLPRDGQ